MVKGILEKLLTEALEALALPAARISLEHPAELSHGDYATNIALALAKQTGKNPRELAQEIVNFINTKISDQSNEGPTFVERVETAGPGFINFHLSRKFFLASLEEILALGENYGKNTRLAGKKVLVEYTDPNPFKEFHIGHLMSNAIGEAISRLVEYSGAETVRACYQGDVGLHVAKAMWGILENEVSYPAPNAPLSDKIKFLGEAYVLGSQKYEEDESAKQEIVELNKKIFEKSDQKINTYYEQGRAWSLEHFEEIYKKLDTKFNHYFFESGVAPDGVKIVKEFLAKGVFELSDGAVVYKGEKHGLHTRVFLNSQGLPTYEAKELGLTKRKFESENPDISIVITASEQNDYFKVVLAALKEIDAVMAEKTKHISHGMLRFASGKMSSRKGNVITGEALLLQVEALVQEKVKDRPLSDADKKRIAEEVSAGAVKYSILKQAPGSDIIYDFDKSISFEGDSGPYLQYSHTRALSVLEKAKAQNAEASLAASEDPGQLEKMLYRFPEMVTRSAEEYAPHHVVTYLVELAAAFNRFYAEHKIIDAGTATAYRLALTVAFATTMKNGLRLLGIKVPQKM